MAGALSEAHRFAQSEGMESPEVQSRLGIVESEQAIMERVDLNPSKLAKTPPRERKVAKEIQQQGRKFRHLLWDRGLSQGRGRPEDIEDAAAEVAKMQQNFKSSLRSAIMEELTEKEKSAEV